jgi:hypothetical protein
MATPLEPAALRRAGRPRLAALLERVGGIPIAEHARALHAHRPRVPLEPELEEAFFLEMLRLGTDPDATEAALADLRARRVLMTATHLTASEGPTFLAAHVLASLGLPPDVPYVVAAYSNVPFSSSAWSGCLNHSDRHGLDALLEPDSAVFRALARDEGQRDRDAGGSQERRISLVPGSLRDARVYRAGLPGKLGEVRAALRAPLSEVLPEATGDSFTAWALRASQAVLARVLPGARPLYLDLGEIVSAYLQRVFLRPEHPLGRLVFEPGALARAQAQLGPLPLFGASEVRGKGQRWAAVRTEGGRLSGAGCDLVLEPDALVEALKDGRLAPGLLLTFAALACLNEVRCLGSFEQVEYLPRIQAALGAAGCFPTDALQAMEVDALATGRCLGRDGLPVWPLDVVLGTPFDVSGAVSVGTWLAPLGPRLLGG